MIKFIATLALILITGGAVFAESKIHDDWRPPTAEEIYDEFDMRSDSPNKYLIVEADFNGDGQADIAKLLVNDKENKMGLFVVLNLVEKQKVFQLVENENKIWIQAMGIAEAKPGSHKTACGKGYFECDSDEPETLNLENSGIDYFKLGSANSYFYWEPKLGNFKRVWMSD